MNAPSHDATSCSMRCRSMSEFQASAAVSRQPYMTSRPAKVCEQPITSLNDTELQLLDSDFKTEHSMASLQSHGLVAHHFVSDHHSLLDARVLKKPP